jgi:HTH-type transcriptional regulator / antitoxin HigA
MQNLDVSKTAAAWSSLAGKVYVPHSEAEYQQLAALLDSMIDEVGKDESHPLASLMEIVGVRSRSTKMSTCRTWRVE